MTGLIVDSFAGAGGASLGIERAMGRPIDVAINHDNLALRVHERNHPKTRHIVDDIWSVDPREAVNGEPVDLAWFSPDCRHFSKAKGGKPVSKSVRGLAWVVIRWAMTVRPAVIIVENVEEFEDWGPLLGNGKPCPARKGRTFSLWRRRLEQAGYVMESRQLRGSRYGAPTIRRRTFFIARRDGLPIVWPEPTHGPGTSNPYRTAAEIIDWSHPCHSIFLTKEEGRRVGVRRPLAEATMRRIAKGVMRYVVESDRPFLVPDPGGMAAPYFAPRYQEKPGHEPRTRPVDQPAATVTTGAHTGHLATAFLSRQFGASIGHGAGEPVGTVTAGGGGKSALVAAFMAQHNTGETGHPMTKPVSTIVGKGCTQGLIAANMISLKGTDRRDGSCEEPAATVCAGGTHAGLVASFLTKYYGTALGQQLTLPMHAATSKARFGLITVDIDGDTYVIHDIGMRMLTPRELARAQGFPDSYIFERVDGRRVTKTDQIRLIGNSVNPQVAEAIVRANVRSAHLEATG